MKPLVSPLETAEWKAPGWRRWGNGHRCYVANLQRQMRERGLVPDEAWETTERLQIARKIEAIVADECYLVEMRFHPNDSYRIVGYYEIGDSSELGALFQIERCFRVSFPRNEMRPLLERRAMFGEFVDLIAAKLTGPRAPGCPECDWQITPRDLKCSHCGKRLRYKSGREVLFSLSWLSIACLVIWAFDWSLYTRFMMAVVLLLVSGIVVGETLRTIDYRKRDD
jgi:hypothetical protein